MAPSAKTIKGVSISCEGDIQFLGATKFIPVDISTLDPVVAAQFSTSSEMLGVPVRVRKLPPDSAWKNSGKCGVFVNEAVTRLFRVMDPQRDDISMAPDHWDFSVGSVLLVRADGKEITPQQVEALCYYSSEHTTDMFHDASEHWGETGSKEAFVELAALFNPKAFRKFFADFKSKKMEKDASWAAGESPI